MFFTYRRVSRYTPQICPVAAEGEGVARVIAAQAALRGASRYAGVSLRQHRLSRFNGPLRPLVVSSQRGFKFVDQTPLTKFGLNLNLCFPSTTAKGKRKTINKTFSGRKWPIWGPVFDPKNPPEKSLCGCLFWRSFQKFMLNKFMCFFRPLVTPIKPLL